MEHFINDPTAWVGIAFLIFFALVAWKIFPKLGVALDSYGAKIAAEIQQATQLREQAEKLLAEAQKKSKAAEQNANEIIERARFEAKLIGDEAEKEIEREIEYKMQLAEEKITRAQSVAMEHVRTRAVDNAIAEATKVLSEEFQNPKSSERLIEKSLHLISGNLN